MQINLQHLLTFNSSDEKIQNQVIKVIIIKNHDIYYSYTMKQIPVYNYRKNLPIL